MPERLQLGGGMTPVACHECDLLQVLPDLPAGMEAVVFDLTQDIDEVEDALLDGGSVPTPQTLSELRRRIFRTRRQVNGTQQVLAPMTTDPAMALAASPDVRSLSASGKTWQERTGAVGGDPFHR